MPFPPPLNAPQEQPGSPFYGIEYIKKAAKPLSFEDARAGRFCTATRMWVPGHRLRWFDGKPYFDKCGPTEKARIVPDPPQGVQ